MPTRAHRDLLALLGRATPELERAFARLASALLDGRDRTPAVAALATTLQGAQQFADLAGRVAPYRLAARAAETFADEVAGVPPVPLVPFAEAIADLLARSPVPASGFEEVQEIYSREHAFALARSADRELTEAVQKAIGRALREGRGGPGAIRREALRRHAEGFSAAYAQTVFRTNVATAFSAGRFRALADPVVAAFVPALEFVAVLDADVRPNHAAAHGFLATADDDRWERLTPPLGYNCRCAVVPVDAAELRRRRALDREGNLRRMPTPRAAVADPGFGQGRPDRALYGFRAAR